MVVLSTASPFKFPGDVLAALGQPAPQGEFEAMEALAGTQAGLRRLLWRACAPCPSVFGRPSGPKKSPMWPLAESKANRKTARQTPRLWRAVSGGARGRIYTSRKVSHFVLPGSSEQLFTWMVPAVQQQAPLL